ncbi:MAG: RHS repeat-associated protein [Thermoproteota archaeon]|jgi:RHS repeat-associated protein
MFNNYSAPSLDNKSTLSLPEGAHKVYLFGMAMVGRDDQGHYRFGFNGKEKDPQGLGGGGSTYDYGFRIYNSSIAKFLSIDPLSPNYPWYTPYQFAGNRPINSIDLDGLEELIIIRWFDNGAYKGETALRVPMAEREKGKQGGDDRQLIQMDLSAQANFQATLRNNKSAALLQLKDNTGSYKGFYSKQFSILDQKKNEKVNSNEQDVKSEDYQTYTPLMQNIMFNFNSSNSKIISEKDLAKFKKMLDMEPERQIVINGYSSDVYDPNLTQAQGDALNQRLSLQRAEDVRDELIAGGIDVSRISSVSGQGGTSKFGSSNNDNQRVQLTFTYDKKKKKP